MNERRPNDEAEVRHSPFWFRHFAPEADACFAASPSTGATGIPGIGKRA
jgi:hypothetical protein